MPWMPPLAAEPSDIKGFCHERSYFSSYRINRPLSHKREAESRGAPLDILWRPPYKTAVA